MEDSSEFVTRQEAARRAGIGLRQITRGIADGEIGAYRIGGWTRVKWSDVQDWIEGQRLSDRGAAMSAYPPRGNWERNGRWW